MIYSKTNILQTNQPKPKEPTKVRKIPGYLKPVKHRDLTSATPDYISFRQEDNLSVSTDTSSTKKTSKVTTSSKNVSTYEKYLPRKVSTLSVCEKLKPIRSLSTVDGEDHNSNTSNNRKTPTESDVLQMASMSSHSIKKLLGQEAEKFRVANDPQSRRKIAVKKLLARNSFPEFVIRRKTTSAIFKEYQNFKAKNRPGFPNIFRNNPGGLKQFEKVLVPNQPLTKNKTVLPSIQQKQEVISLP